MLDNKEDITNKEHGEILSKSFRSGKRTYFFDVKSSRNDEPYLTITESKRCFNENSGTFYYEKHKIFLRREDIVSFHTELGTLVEDMNTANLFSETPRQAEDKEENSSDLDCNGLE